MIKIPETYGFQMNPVQSQARVGVQGGRELAAAQYRQSQTAPTALDYIAGGIGIVGEAVELGMNVYNRRAEKASMEDITDIQSMVTQYMQTKREHDETIDMDELNDLIEGRMEAHLENRTSQFTMFGDRYADDFENLVEGYKNSEVINALRQHNNATADNAWVQKQQEYMKSPDATYQGWINFARTAGVSEQSIREHTETARAYFEQKEVAAAVIPAIDEYITGGLTPDEVEIVETAVRDNAGAIYSSVHGGGWNDLSEEEREAFSSRINDMVDLVVERKMVDIGNVYLRDTQNLMSLARAASQDDETFIFYHQQALNQYQKLLELRSNSEFYGSEDFNKVIDDAYRLLMTNPRSTSSSDGAIANVRASLNWRMSDARMALMNPVNYSDAGRYLSILDSGMNEALTEVVALQNNPGQQRAYLENISFFDVDEAITTKDELVAAYNQVLRQVSLANPYIDIAGHQIDGQVVSILNAETYVHQSGIASITEYDEREKAVQNVFGERFNQRNYDASMNDFVAFFMPGRAGEEMRQIFNSYVSDAISPDEVRALSVEDVNNYAIAAVEEWRQRENGKTDPFVPASRTFNNALSSQDSAIPLRFTDEEQAPHVIGDRILTVNMFRGEANRWNKDMELIVSPLAAIGSGSPQLMTRIISSLGEDRFNEYINNSMKTLLRGSPYQGAGRLANFRFSYEHDQVTLYYDSADYGAIEVGQLIVDNQPVNHNATKITDATSGRQVASGEEIIDSFSQGRLTYDWGAEIYLAANQTATYDGLRVYDPGTGLTQSILNINTGEQIQAQDVVFYEEQSNVPFLELNGYLAAVEKYIIEQRRDDRDSDRIQPRGTPSETRQGIQ